MITPNVMIKWKQAHIGFTDFGFDVGSPDIVSYAESYGAYGHRLSAVVECIFLLDSCFQTPWVHVIVVTVDYSDNDRILNHEIKEKSRFL